MLTSIKLSFNQQIGRTDVGNKAAVFPLQLLGFDVDVINSVHFSNHTGYKSGWEGSVMNGSELESILLGLERNQLLDQVGHVLTGYIGSESFLRSVLKVLQKVKEQNNSARYVCDPVFGDNGEFYAPQELVPIYRKEIIPLADVVTPNQFEAEQLTGLSIKTLKDAKSACDILHELGPEYVIITSAALIDDDSKGEEKITILASKRCKNNSSEETEYERWCIDSPILPGRYTGTGDLCAALFLAWTAKEPGDLSSALQKVISTMYSVIKRTMEKNGETVASNELRIIQSKELIEAPPVLFHARRIY